MSHIRTKRIFGFRLAILHGAAVKIQGALKDPGVGKEMAEYLPPDLVPELDASIDALADCAADQDLAIGTVGGLTAERRDALADCTLGVSVARGAAKAAFRQNETVLSSEFMVGVNAPRDIDSVLQRARTVMAACEKHGDVLAEHCWPASATRKLGAAIETLSTAYQEQHKASDAKEGTTAEQTNLANALFLRIREVQNAAKLAYPKRKAARDASVVEARARFLLGEFPPWKGKETNEATAEPDAAGAIEASR